MLLSSSLLSFYQFWGERSNNHLNIPVHVCLRTATCSHLPDPSIFFLPYTLLLQAPPPVVLSPLLTSSSSRPPSLHLFYPLCHVPSISPCLLPSSIHRMATLTPRSLRSYIDGNLRVTGNIQRVKRVSTLLGDGVDSRCHSRRL